MNAPSPQQAPQAVAGTPLSSTPQTRLHQTLQRAVQAGWLPDAAAAAALQSAGSSARPWPVLLLIALGAWLAALPLLGVVGLLLGDFVQRGIGPYLVGALVLAGATVVLRAKPVPLFLEQLALPALLVGGGSLGFGLFRDLADSGAALVLALAVLAVAAALPQAWLRSLLGVAGAGLVAVALTPRAFGAWVLDTREQAWFAVHGLVLLGLLAQWAQGQADARTRALLEPLRAGWWLATLAGLAAWSGHTMLVGASLGSGVGGDIARMGAPAGRLHTLPMQAVSAVLALAGAAWAARQWPALRQPWCAAAALLLAALAAFMPALGAVGLVLALCATTGRPRMAAAAGLAALWIVGAFYYALAWPLQLKALVLLAAGAGLAALAWWALHGAATSPAATATTAVNAPVPRARLGLALSVAAVLVLANVGIWQKERLIAQGQPLFVELAPVDPRSLMQGDYMRLRFALPADVRDPAPGLLAPTRPVVLARRDARGVATLRLASPQAPPQADELAIELAPKGGDWVLVTDAWFFAEGEAERWQAARYGEFRVDGSGRALLVGLRGAALQPL